MNAFMEFMTAAGPWILMGLGLAIVIAYLSNRDKNKKYNQDKQE